MSRRVYAVLFAVILLTVLLALATVQALPSSEDWRTGDKPAVDRDGFGTKYTFNGEIRSDPNHITIPMPNYGISSHLDNGNYVWSHGDEFYIDASTLYSTQGKASGTYRLVAHHYILLYYNYAFVNYSAVDSYAYPDWNPYLYASFSLTWGSTGMKTVTSWSNRSIVYLKGAQGDYSYYFQSNTGALGGSTVGGVTVYSGTYVLKLHSWFQLTTPNSGGGGGGGGYNVPLTISIALINQTEAANFTVRVTGSWTGVNDNYWHDIDSQLHSLYSPSIQLNGEIFQVKMATTRVPGLMAGQLYKSVTHTHSNPESGWYSGYFTDNFGEFLLGPYFVKASFDTCSKYTYYLKKPDGSIRYPTKIGGRSWLKSFQSIDNEDLFVDGSCGYSYKGKVWWTINWYIYNSQPVVFEFQYWKLTYLTGSGWQTVYIPSPSFEIQPDKLGIDAQEGVKAEAYFVARPAKAVNLYPRANTDLQANVSMTVDTTRVTVPLNSYRPIVLEPEKTQATIGTQPSIFASKIVKIDKVLSYPPYPPSVINATIPGTYSGYYNITAPISYQMRSSVCCGKVTATLVVTLVTSKGKVLYNTTLSVKDGPELTTLTTTINVQNAVLDNEQIILMTKRSGSSISYVKLTASFNISQKLNFDRWEVTDLATGQTKTYKTPSITVSLGSKGVNATAWYVQVKPFLKVIVLPLGTMYLPGEGIATPWLENMSNWAWNGTWTLNVTELYPVKEHIAMILTDGSNVKVVDLPNGTGIKVYLPAGWKNNKYVKSMGQAKVTWIPPDRDTLAKTFPAVNITVDGNTETWYLVALAAWNPYKQFNEGYDTSCWLSNGTTLAVYNLTFTYTFKNGTRVVFKEPVVVSALKTSAMPIYSIGDMKQGLSLQVTVKWKYLPPAKTGIQPQPPSSIVGVAVIGDKVYNGTLIDANATSKTFFVAIANDTWSLYAQGVTSVTASAYWISSMMTPEGPVAMQDQASLGLVYLMPHLDGINEGQSLTATISVLDIKTNQPYSANIYIELRDNRTYSVVATYGPYYVPGQATITIDMPNTKQYVMAIYALPVPQKDKLVVPIPAVYPPRV